MTPAVKRTATEAAAVEMDNHPIQAALPHSLSVSIPFPTADLARIAAAVLAVDRPLKPTEAIATYAADPNDDAVLIINASASSLKMLRTSVNSILEQLISVTNTMVEFAP
ncbi:transcription factor Pcc1-domain-containing protein [Blastocladiella britannica]|nr:transcription factor Pcc1-domain-containing protein [Blastocladiella britannica]